MAVIEVTDYRYGQRWLVGEGKPELLFTDVIEADERVGEAVGRVAEAGGESIGVELPLGRHEEMDAGGGDRAEHEEERPLEKTADAARPEHRRGEDDHRPLHPGVMEPDGETPWEACRREVREECGTECRTGRLACMDFRRPRPGRPGGIRFLFDCGAVGDTELAAIVVQPEEISQYRLAALPDALPLLRRPIRRRVRAASRSPGLVYLEDGRPVPGVGATRS